LLRTTYRNLLVPVLTAAACLTGCVTAVDLDARLAPWREKDEAAVVGRFGAPHRSYDLKDGTRVLTYASGRDEIRSVPGHSRFFRDPVLTSYRYDCSVHFTLDAERKVRDARWEGDLAECRYLVRGPLDARPAP
jgi:hypothetical protein